MRHDPEAYDNVIKYLISNDQGQKIINNSFNNRK